LPANFTPSAVLASIVVSMNNDVTGSVEADDGVTVWRDRIAVGIRVHDKADGVCTCAPAVMTSANCRW
jgi:hypothetical protein